MLKILKGRKFGQISSYQIAHIHAEKHIVLGADPQVLPDGAELRADVLAEDVGSTRSGWEQAGQD